MKQNCRSLWICVRIFVSCIRLIILYNFEITFLSFCQREILSTTLFHLKLLKIYIVYINWKKIIKLWIARSSKRLYKIFWERILGYILKILTKKYMGGKFSSNFNILLSIYKQISIFQLFINLTSFYLFFNYMTFLILAKIIFFQNFLTFLCLWTNNHICNIIIHLFIQIFSFWKTSLLLYFKSIFISYPIWIQISHSCNF